MPSLSQALLLEYLPSSHSAFQGHAAHTARWPAMLRPKGSWGACTPQGIIHSSTVLHGADPRTLNASGFVLTITVEGQATPITMTVAASAVGACVAAGQPATPDTYCASFACFPPGSRLGVTVQAQVSTQLSGPSNLGGCIVDLQCNC